MKPKTPSAAVILTILSELKVGDSAWDDGERILTVNGAPCGMTIGNHAEVDRWWPGLKREIALHLAKRLEE